MTTLFYQIVNPANRITKIRLLKQYNTTTKNKLRHCKFNEFKK